MTTRKKDYYEVLGVERTANDTLSFSAAKSFYQGLFAHKSL